METVTDGLRDIVAIANQGHLDLLWSEIERYLRSLVPAERIQVLVHVGGQWRPWDFTTSNGDTETSSSTLPADSIKWQRVRVEDNFLFLPIQAAAVCAVATEPKAPSSLIPTLDLVAITLSSVVTTCEKQFAARRNLDDVQSMQRVATRILKSHNLAEIMQLITIEAQRILSADISGIMLREGDEVVMKQCVGNLSPTTAALRMKQGQGIAGQVFAGKQPCRVEDYLLSDSISRDFFSLAKDEKVRSAIAAPLMSHDEVIGVLEVWRRRPSTFTDLESLRLVVLANLVSIAIENARLYASSENALKETEKANLALNERYGIVRNLVTLNEELVNLLLGGYGLPAIAKCVAGHVDARILIADRDLHILAASDDQHQIPADVLAKRNSMRGENYKADEKPMLFSCRENAEMCLAQRIYVAKELVGFIIVLSPGPINDETNLVIAQVTLVVALHWLEQRSVSRARSETMDAVVWDLLQGADNIRHAAVERLREMKIDLPRPTRVWLLTFENIGKSFSAAPVGYAVHEEWRQVLREVCASSESDTVRQSVLGGRGGSFNLLVSSESADNVEKNASRLVRRLSERLPGLAIYVGASGPRDDPLDLPSALREANISADVAKQRGRTGVAVYERSGIVGLLYSVRHNSGVHNLVDSTFGRLMSENPKKRQQLVETLRVYFDLNCSQEAAAHRLGVHRKTIGYRLSRISELTGLDFSTHEDRLLADLVLYISSMREASAEY